MIDRKKLSQMSGENEAGSAPKLILNQIRFNGKKGQYVYEDVKSGTIEVDGKKTYKKTLIGNEISLVFLKIRRRLYQFRKDEKARVTNEHNHPGAKVVLYGDKIENGIASELREKYPQLRTQQIIYALYKGELIRLFIKGASLGSKTKPKDVDDFYSYIGKFKGDDHFYDFETILKVGEEKSDLGEYFVMHFERGVRIPDEDMEAVAANMEEAFEHCKEADEYYASKMPKDIEKEVSVKEEIDTVEYPEDDIDPKDIPF